MASDASETSSDIESSDASTPTANGSIGAGQESSKSLEPVSTKRKRDPDDGDAPNKKVLVNGFHPSDQEASPDVTHDSKPIEFLDSDELYPPVIASTDAIFVPSNSAFTSYQDSSHKKLLLHSVDHSELDYVGREYDKKDTQGKLNHYIATYDPSTGDIKVTKAKAMLVERTVCSQEDDQEPNTTSGRSLAGRNRLGLEFGNKKAKRVIETSSQNRINTIALTNGVSATSEDIKTAIQENPSALAMLNSMATSAALAPAKALMQETAAKSKPRPLNNPEATKVEDHYPLSQLIKDDVLQDIKVKPWVDAIDAGLDVTTRNRFVANRLKPIIQANPHDMVPKVKILKWMETLMNFHAMGRKSKTKGLTMPKPSKIRDELGESTFWVDEMIKKFGSPSGELTKWQVDYMISHLAVLSLIVDDFKTDTFDLKEDLRLEAKQITSYFREIGAKVKIMTEAERQRTKLEKAESKLHRIATLGEVLEFPQIRQRIRQQR